MGIQGEADLFPGLPDGGSEQVLIRGIPTTTGKSHVTRPGVASPLGPLDYQDGIGVGSYDQGDRCFTHFRVIDRDGSPTVKP